MKKNERDDDLDSLDSIELEQKFLLADPRVRFLPTAYNPKEICEYFSMKH